MLNVEQLTELFFDTSFIWSDYITCRHFNKFIDFLEGAGFMYIPVDTTKAKVEVPTFLYKAFRNALVDYYQEGKKTFIAPLLVSPRETKFTSTPRVLEDVLQNSYHKARALVPIKIKGLDKKYYGCHGAIFDDNMKPLMVSTCVLSILSDEEDICVTDKSVLRVSKEMFSDDKDSLKKYVISKIIPAAANTKDERNEDVQVIIGNIPFKTVKPSEPDITVSNQEILQAALDHYKEIL